MKKIITFCLLSLALWVACQPQQPEPLVIEEPAVVLPDTFAIGDGVEIYRALLDWKSGPRLTRYFTTGTVLNEKPLIRYNDIKRYYQLITPAGDKRIAFEMNKKIFDGFNQEPSVLGKAFLTPQSASDTGFVVTIDKKPIYFAYYRTYFYGGVIERNLAFVRVRDRDYLNQPQENILPVIWDSIYEVTQSTPRPEPDPRFDSRLLERLKKDGKLGF